jgi:cyclophilin family peptidyl-prolyl cis-trans isomerase/photosystem II stability/assembly factor-like uncharacterized protein
MAFRSIGPAVTGGRVHDVQALPDDPSTVYIATATSGLWKTTNAGTTWTSLFDDQPNSTFGVIAIAPSNPDVVWAGTGEQNNRQSSSWGNGVYRSTDAGGTWQHLGLTETRAIGRILIDPRDPDRAWVGALGNLWKASPERGVFRTMDGGATWQKVLYVDTLTGIVDMAMDPANPNTLYAAAYQRIRSPCCFNGGGPGSGIYKSTDGGTTWNRLTNGLPPGDLGRIGITISRTNPRLLYATVEHSELGGVYRSDDGGATWTRTNPLNSRPMYYSAIYVDPTNDQRVYMLARYFYQSEDGGRTWRTMPTEPKYVKDGHYDGTVFHRVIGNFMVQGGGFDKDMKQKPTRETIKNEANNGLKNEVGTIAMARTQDPHSASAQFFINVADNGFLNFTAESRQGWGYAVFGKVVDGMDVVNNIKGVKTTTQGFYENVPVNPVIIEKAVMVDAK